MQPVIGTAVQADTIIDGAALQPDAISVSLQPDAIIDGADLQADATCDGATLHPDATSDGTAIRPVMGLPYKRMQSLMGPLNRPMQLERSLSTGK